MLSIHVPCLFYLNSYLNYFRTLVNLTTNEPILGGPSKEGVILSYYYLDHPTATTINGCGGYSQSMDVGYTIDN